MIDPRDAEAEIESPTYRVTFADSHGATEEWRLTGCHNVLEVIAWAKAEAHRRSYWLDAEWPTSIGVGLVRLLECNDH